MERKKLTKLIWRLLLGAYLFLVLYETILSRPLNSYYGYHLELFYSYRLAHTLHSMFEWRCIILNYFMLMPLGFALPLCFEKCQRLNTFIFGFTTSLLIELTQLILHVGIFEVDDIFGNVIGCIVGYEIYLLCKFIISKNGLQTDITKKIIRFQIPLLVLVSIMIYFFVFQNYTI